MAKNNKTCMVCGKEYFYCYSQTCGEEQPGYMALVHDENCHKIFSTLNKLYFQHISEAEAITELEKCDLSVLGNINTNHKIMEQIDAVMAKKPKRKSKKVEKVVEEPVEEVSTATADDVEDFPSIVEV